MNNEGVRMDAYKVLLGEILIQRKRITPAQLDDALQVQKKNGGFIGEILVSLGILDERDIVVALVIQCGLPYIAVNKYAITPQIVHLIPKEVAQKEKVIALDRIGEILSVVMVNPLTDDKKNYLETLTKCRIATFISTKAEIEEAIARNY
jgi:type IV pilus assembly protein PilB